MFELVNVDLEKQMDKALHFTAKNLSKSGHNPKPVLLHSFKVAMNLYLCGYEEKVITASILHDLIEDTDVTKKNIAKEYGEEIANIVEAVSFNPNIEDKLEQAREMFNNCCKYGRDALLVKCSDLLDNVSFVYLASEDIRPKLLKKYVLFLEMSKKQIGKEKIYKLLANKVKKMGITK